MSRPAPALRLLHLDVATYQVTLGDKPVQLTPTEWRILALLIHHAGTTATYRSLIDAMYPGSRSPMKRLQQDIAAIRAKLGQDATRYVQTDRAAGGYTVPTAVLAPRPDPLAGYIVATDRNRVTLRCPWSSCATSNLLAVEMMPVTVNRIRELAAWHELEHRAAPDED